MRRNDTNSDTASRSTRMYKEEENWFFGNEVLLSSFEQATNVSLALIDEALRT